MPYPKHRETTVFTRTHTASARQHVGSTAVVSWRDLDPAARATIAAALYAIYCERSGGLTCEQFTAFFLYEQTRLCLMYDAQRQLVGFCNATLMHIEHGGQPHAVFAAGVYIRRAYKASHIAARFGLTEALRFRARHPNTPLAYMAIASNPAPYRLFAQVMPRFYPSRHVPAPAALDPLVRLIAARRGLRFVSEDDPWLVHAATPPTDPTSAAQAASLIDDPDARFYLTRNSGFADARALLVWIPLDTANILGALLRLARQQATPRRWLPQRAA
jgi:hypothetical protein